MAILNFPNSPADGDSFSFTNLSGGTTQYLYDSDRTLWYINASGITGPTGPAGANGADGADGTNGTNGADGLGFTGGSYDSATGIITFTSDDGLGFATTDVRGATGPQGPTGPLDSAAAISLIQANGVTTGKAIAMAIVFG